MNVQSSLPVFASYQNLILDDGRSHRLAVTQFRIRNVALPDHGARLRIQGHELGIKGSNINEVAENLDAAVVGTAAVSRYRSHLVIIVPELYAGFCIKRIDMAERRRHIHDAVDDDRRRLQRFLDIGLEDPGDVQALYGVAVDLLGRMKSRLGIIAIGQKKIVDVLVCCVELLLSNRRNRCLARRRLGFLLGFLRTDGPREQSSHAEQCGASNRKSIHVSAPNYYC